MRIVFALGLSLAGLFTGAVRAEEPRRFEVPRTSQIRERAETPDAAPTHEILLAADVVARPGETPAEALSRALHSSDEDSSTDSP